MNVKYSISAADF